MLPVFYKIKYADRTPISACRNTSKRRCSTFSRRWNMSASSRDSSWRCLLAWCRKRFSWFDSIRSLVWFMNLIHQITWSDWLMDKSDQFFNQLINQINYSNRSIRSRKSINNFQITKGFKLQPTCKHPEHEIEYIGTEDLNALSEILGDKPYFFGDKATHVSFQDFTVAELIKSSVFSESSNPISIFRLTRPYLAC